MFERKLKAVERRIGMRIVIRGVRSPDPSLRGRVSQRRGYLLLEYQVAQPGYFWELHASNQADFLTSDIFRSLRIMCHSQGCKEEANMSSVPSSAGSRFDPAADLGLAVEVFISACSTRGLTPSTLSFYSENLRDLSAFLTNGRTLSPVEVTRQTLREFTASLQERRPPLSIRSVNCRLQATKRLFGFLHEEQYLPGNVAECLRLLREQEKPVTALSADEVSRLLKALNKSRSFEDLRDGAAIAVMLDSGLRVSELLSLTVDDVDLVGLTLSPRHTKSGRARVVPVGQLCRQRLLLYLRQREKRALTPALFVNRSGEALARSTLQHKLRKLGRKLHFPNLGCHLLRRSCATAYVRNGGNIFHLQALLGHRSLEMVKRYTRVTPEDLRDAHRVVSPLDRLTR